MMTQGDPGVDGAVRSNENALFLLSELQGSRTASLATGDLQALRSVSDWIQTFIIEPNENLGRSGPVCPFTPVAINHDALWLALEHTEGQGLSAMIERVRRYNRLLLANEPTHGEFASYKAIFIVFADLPAGAAQEFFDSLLKPIGLPFYAHDGLVIGPFFEGNEGTAIYNANFRPFRSPVPCLLMRRAVVSDWKFFLNNPEWFEVWKRTHAGEAVDALAAALRELPWNVQGRT